jgi:hypothetical protein
MTRTPIFFDSHGNAHITCRCDHPDAAAFGPAGCSREATADDLARSGLRVVRGKTAWHAAVKAGRLVRAEEPHEFDALGPTRLARRRAVKAHMMGLPRADRRRIRRARCTVQRAAKVWRAAPPGCDSAIAWDRLAPAIRRLISAQDAVALSGPVAPSGVMAAWRLGV